MWFLIGWLLGRGRRRPSVEEREWRQRRGHPSLFLLVCALLVGAVGTGSWGWAVLLLIAALWLVVRA